MAETEPGTRPVRARIGNTGEEGRRHPEMCLSHQPRGEELPINHLALPAGKARLRAALTPLAAGCFGLAPWSYYLYCPSALGRRARHARLTAREHLEFV